MESETTKLMKELISVRKDIKATTEKLWELRVKEAKLAFKHNQLIDNKR